MQTAWKRIGLTGGISSGKSTVSRWLAKRGVPVVDADQVARQVVEPGTPGLAQLVETFGQDILQEDGSLDRKQLGQIVFSNEAQRQRLNGLMHGMIREEMHRQAQAWYDQGYETIIYDVPLLIETGWYQEMDEVWLVYVGPNRQLRRLMARDGWTQEEAQQRIDSQMPLAEKKAFADRIIYNTRTMQFLYGQLFSLWRKVGAQFQRKEI